MFKLKSECENISRLKPVKYKWGWLMFIVTHVPLTSRSLYALIEIIRVYKAMKT